MDSAVSACGLPCSITLKLRTSGGVYAAAFADAWMAKQVRGASHGILVSVGGISMWLRRVAGTAGRHRLECARRRPRLS